MKRKSLMCLILIVIVVFSVFSMTTRFIDAVNNPVLSVVLSGTTSTNSISSAVGATFNVDVRVDNIGSVTPGVNCVSYGLTWNPAVLSCTAKSDNSWLPSQSSMGDLPLNSTSGMEIIGQIAFDISNPAACATTGGVSVNFTFQVVSAGTCTIGLQPSDVGVAYLTYPDSQGNSHNVVGTTTLNATFTSSAPSNSLVNIDVFTSKGGVGKSASGGAYGPLQMVPTYALVTYGGASMPNENVMFTILDANGTSYYRQGVTNESGVATIQPSFRLPAPDYGSPHTSFGKWSITASVTVSGATMSDNVTFTFAYLTGIGNVTIPASTHRNESLPIQLTINNQEISAQWTKLSITLFDHAGAPIGSSIITASGQTENITVVDAAITIPSWAFTGQATAYLCLLSNSTNVPLAPESTAKFNILS